MGSANRDGPGNFTFGYVFNNLISSERTRLTKAFRVCTYQGRRKVRSAKVHISYSSRCKKFPP